jgi:hypothetical protein
MKKQVVKAALAKELAKRTQAGKSVDVLSVCFPQQAAFINDPARLKAVFCTRRAAKSYSAGLHAYHTAQANPNAKILYIGLTRDTARLIFWNDVLKAAAKQLNIKVRFHETFLEATLPNGAMIKLLGMDSSDEEKEKALGQKYALVLIDEAASFTIDLSDLVYRVLKPAVMDLGGTICLLGTPGNVTSGLFFDVTSQSIDKETGLQLEGGWSLHRWHTRDNTSLVRDIDGKMVRVCDQYERELAEIARDRPLYMQTAAFKQMYLGEWAPDDDARVYRYQEPRNLTNALPKTKWSYVLGLDLGYEDDTAFVVLAYNHYTPALHIVEVYKRKHMDITDVANKVRELDRKYDFDFKIIDGANKQAVQELNNRHQLSLVSADKTGKDDFIQIMNDEFIQRKILLLPGAQPLADEYKKLVWYTKKTKQKTTKVEHPNLPNHACDAALYAWRYTYTYIQKTPKPEYKPGDPEYDNQKEDRHIERIRAKQSNGNGFPTSHW